MGREKTNFNSSKLRIKHLRIVRFAKKQVMVLIISTTTTEETDKTEIMADFLTTVTAITEVLDQGTEILTTTDITKDFMITELHGTIITQETTSETLIELARGTD